MTLNATVEATGKAKIQSGSLGNKSLQVGDNEFKIVVIAEDNETKTTYTVKVHRKSNNNNLKLMDVTSTPTGSELNIPLDNNLTSYTYKYIEGTTTYTVSATVDDTDKASVAIVDANNVSNGVGSTLNSASYTFDITTTKVNVIVTSENGDVKTYEINIARKQSTDTTLKSLEISSGSGADLTEYTLSPEFPSDTRNYYLTVESEISEVNINAIPTSENAKGVKITGNYNNLAFDTNLIEIKTTRYMSNLQIKNVNVDFKNKDVVNTIEILELIEIIDNYSDVNAEKLYEFLKNSALEFKEDVLYKVLAAHSYKKRNVATLKIVLDFFNVKNNLSRLLNTASKYNFPKEIEKALKL